MLGATETMRQIAEVFHDNKPERNGDVLRQWESDIISVGMVLAKTVPKFKFNDFATRCGLMGELRGSKPRDVAKIIREVK